MIVKALKKLWTIYFFVWFLLLFLVLYPAFFVLLSQKKWYRKAHALRRLWGNLLMAITGLRGKAEYEVPLDREATYVFTPNHFSYFDIVSVNTQMPHFFSFMAKKELANIPLFRIFFRTIDMPVDRKNKDGAKRIPWNIINPIPPLSATRSNCQPIRNNLNRERKVKITNKR